MTLPCHAVIRRGGLTRRREAAGPPFVDRCDRDTPRAMTALARARGAYVVTVYCTTMITSSRSLRFVAVRVNPVPIGTSAESPL